MAASQQNIDHDTPMGAHLVADGASFRVWAPGAEAVYVVTKGFDQSAPGRWVPNEADTLVSNPWGYWAGYFPGVKEGDPYRYWVAGKGSAGFKRDPRALELERFGWPNVNCVVRGPSAYPWHDAGHAAPPFHELVIYQLHIGVFSAVDKAGNDVRAGRVSKFLDVLDRIEYLADLGVNAIEPLPVVEWQGESSRGYNNSDFYSPETDYCVGSTELYDYLNRVNALLKKKGETLLAISHLVTQGDQLRAMVDVCHLHGISVIFDVVYNHAGPGIDDDDQSMRFINRPWNRQWWDPDPYFIGGAGWAGGRIFDYKADEVRQFLIDNAVSMIQEYHIDGIRYDEVTVIRDNNGSAFCRDLTDSIRYVKPSLIQVAEYWHDDRAIAVQPTPDGLGFDAAWHDVLRDAIRGAVGASAGGASATVNLDGLRDALRRPGGFPAWWRNVNCVENHDLVDGDRPPGATKPRIPALAHATDRRGWLARSRSRVATGLLLTAPGIPLLFMGQEFLEDKPWHNNPKHPEFFIYWDGLKSPGGDPAMKDFLRFTRDLCRLRRRHPALRDEGVNPYFNHNGDRVLAFQRWVEGVGRDVVVVATLSEQTLRGYPLPFPSGGQWLEVFNSDAYDSTPNPWGFNPNAAGNGGGVTANGPPRGGMAASAWITIPANGLLVFARDRGDA